VARLTENSCAGAAPPAGAPIRRLEYLLYINATLSDEAVAVWHAHAFADPAHPEIECHIVPAINALNLLLHDARDGGAFRAAFDLMGKGFAQQRLDFPVPIPSSIAAVLERAAIDPAASSQGSQDRL
jgi:hypothetical protein